MAAAATFLKSASDSRIAPDQKEQAIVAFDGDAAPQAAAARPPAGYEDDGRAEAAPRVPGRSPHDPFTGPSWDYDSTRPASWGTLSAQAPPLCCCYARKLGRMFVFIENTGRSQRQGGPRLGSQFLCIGGPCWPMIFFTLGLLLGIPIAAILFFFPEEDSKNKTFATVAIGIAMVITTVTYLRTACGDPGIHPRFPERPPADYLGYFKPPAPGSRRARRLASGDLSTPSRWTWHETSKSYRPPGVMWDAETQVLIEDIDHFCPWTGTTIGAGNLCCFYAFTSSICGLLICTILGIIVANS